MIGITKKVLEEDLPTVFTVDDLKQICPDDNIRRCQMRRAMKNNEIVKLQRGLYTLERTYRKHPIDSMVLSQKIDPDSYVSMMSALRNYNWIPEAVYLCTCVTAGREKFVDCKLINFDFRNIKQNDYSKGVRRVNYFGESFKQATPLKALADYISWICYEWDSLEPLTESLRIEENDLETLKAEDFDELQGNYPKYPNTEKFLSGIRKELGL